jgi:hypothetical protein
MDMGDAMMMFVRGQCREGGAENNCSGKRSYFCLAEHFRISCLSFAAYSQHSDG